MLTHHLSIVVSFAVSILTAMNIAKASDPSPSEIQTAVEKSLTLIQKSNAEYRKHRQCFSCHHQALPALTLAEARTHGFKIDEENFQKNLEWTAAHLKRGQAKYQKGAGQGGQVDTAGYALWALQTGEWKPDETTSAVIEYLLLRDKDRDHWRRSGNRPPSEASDITSTYGAIRALDAFGPSEQRERITARQVKTLAWIQKQKPKDTEERVFRLRTLSHLGAPEDEIQAAADELLVTQRDDGGWSQTSELTSDAYATGIVLVALDRVGALGVSDGAYQRGVTFLIGNQLDDGSWHVKSRSKPFQKYFESGFPHGKDQFISMAASCWATTALILASPAETSQPTSKATIAQLKKLRAKLRFDDDGRIIEINLQETKTTNEDLVHVVGLRSVTEVSLYQTRVTSAGLVHLSGLVNIEKLFLTDTKTDDEGLIHVGRLRELRILGLSGTAVSDAGLEHLKNLRNLKSLFLIDTRVTDAGVKKLQEKLPDCDITY
ncbi:MAG: hypothetical protein IH991_14860 [Planctomycetes bacterium]|nr:hypothetical protein [Planctomycetota bacterium]